jgi:hypothetical protein
VTPLGASLQRTHYAGVALRWRFRYFSRMAASARVTAPFFGPWVWWFHRSYATRAAIGRLRSVRRFSDNAGFST